LPPGASCRTRAQGSGRRSMQGYLAHKEHPPP
jgi:hypothetical protein